MSLNTSKNRDRRRMPRPGHEMIIPKVQQSRSGEFFIVFILFQSQLNQGSLYSPEQFAKKTFPVYFKVREKNPFQLRSLSPEKLKKKVASRKCFLKMRKIFQFKSWMNVL